MDWKTLIDPTRLGCEGTGEKDNRNSYHRDFDRIIFSKEFRLLQAKTQVVPFPEHDTIHTRLTHSLETASVGRSLGTLAALKLDLCEKSNDIGAIVSAACLCHDIGNPPLGHSGEDAISHFFRDAKGGRLIRENLTKDQCYDFQHFEGNAIGFNLLTSSNPDKTTVQGGLSLTYSTLAAFVKYPNRRIKKYDKEQDPAFIKKPGLLRHDVDTFKQIAAQLQLPQIEDNVWARHPLAYLTEASDDICYAVIDLEDGYRNESLTYNEARELLLAIIEGDPATKDSLRDTNIKDNSERIGYYRSKAINSLINQCVDAFAEHNQEIMAGTFKSTLIQSMSDSSCSAYKALINTAVEKVYKRRDILLTEAAGFVVLPGLLDIFVSAVFENNNRSSKIRDCILKDLICSNESLSHEDRSYQTLLNIVKYVALMTDSYAVKLYRELNGIELPNY